MVTRTETDDADERSGHLYFEVDAVVRFAEESSASVEDGNAATKTDGPEVDDSTPHRPNAGFTPTALA